MGIELRTNSSHAGILSATLSRARSRGSSVTWPVPDAFRLLINVACNQPAHELLGDQTGHHDDERSERPAPDR
jgi:hypothetical protein